MRRRGVTGGRPPAALEIVPVGPVDPRLLDPLVSELSRRLGARVRVVEGVPLLSRWLEPARGQYRSSEIVDALIDRAEAIGADGSWTLGITAADLWVPGRTFVFGEATVGGCCALVSTARLEDPRDPDRTFRRLLVEALHELGHVAGLDHCRRPGCVMLPSEGAMDVDRKGDRLCRSCQAHL